MTTRQRRSARVQANWYPQQGEAGDPLAAFTDFQWYCFQARQTVHFSAYSTDVFTRKRLVVLLREIMRFAPQLNTGYRGARPGVVPDDAVLDRLIDISETGDLDAYPDAWPVDGAPFEAEPDLPFIRIRVVTNRDGVDDRGRRSAIQILSTHALMEGADSALLSRSQAAYHSDIDPLPIPPRPLGESLLTALIAAFAAPAQLLAAFVVAPRQVDFGRRTLVVERARLRQAALAIGVRQRSLMFALVAHALNDGGKGFSRRALSCLYTDLNSAGPEGTVDSFFRFRLMEAKFRVEADFFAFARTVDAEIGRVEARDATGTQRRVNALFGVHRRLKRWFPRLYPSWIFRFTGFYHLDLSMVPPHRLSGPLAKGLMEPIFCGTYHEGLNACVFAPGRRAVTLNFNVQRRHLPRVEAVLELLDAVEKRAFKPV